MSRLLRSLLVALVVTAFLVVLVSFLVLIGLWVHARFMASDTNGLFARSGGIRWLYLYVLAAVIFAVTFGVIYRRSRRNSKPRSQ